MVPAMAKAETSRKVKAVEDAYPASPAEALSARKRGATAADGPSLRERLADYFRAGHNASDRELAAMFGASVGSISVYRCQLKKLGIGVASPPAVRAKSEGRGRKPGALAPRPTGAKPARGRRGGAEAAPRAEGGALSLGEIDQVLVQNIETELGLIVERYPDLARPVANVQQTVRLLLKLHR
jgi:hypothetical protein